MSEMIVGAVVRLKSGGPEMTVIHVHEGTDKVSCCWFKDGRGKIYNGLFPVAALEVIREEEPWKG